VARKAQSTGDNTAPAQPDDSSPPAAGSVPDEAVLQSLVEAGSRLTLTAPPVSLLKQYFLARHVEQAGAGVLAGVCVRGAGSWLLARLIGDTLTTFTPNDRDRLLQRLGVGTISHRAQVLP
jgi:hypothetical protein